MNSVFSCGQQSVLDGLPHNQKERLGKIQKAFETLKSDGFPVEQLSPSLRIVISRISSTGGGFFSSYMILQRVLENYITVKEMKFQDKNWKQLSSLIANTETKIIKQCATSLHDSFIKGKNKLLGNSLLVLLSLFLNDTVSPPNIDFCSVKKVKEGLDQLLNNYAKAKDTRFIEFLLLDSFDGEGKLFLTYIDNRRFIDYITEALTSIPFPNWKRKEAVLINLLSLIDKPHRIEVSQKLKSSQNEIKTCEIGCHFVKIFESATFTEALPALQKIPSLLPNFTETDCIKIFKLPFPSFRSVQETESGPSFVRLGFNDKTKVLADNTYLYSSYKSLDNRHWFLAYDTHKHSLSWGVEIPGALIDFAQKHDAIGLILKSSSYQLLLLNPKNGETISHNDLPVPKHMKIESTFICRNFCYLTLYDYDKKLLYGISYRKEIWSESFKKTFPHSNIRQIDDFILYRDSKNSNLHVVNQKGKILKLPHFHDALYHQDKLYAVKKKGGRYFICQYDAPKGTNFRLGHHTKKFGISGLPLKFLGITQPGKALCYADDYRLCFIDFNYQTTSTSNFIMEPHKTIIFNHESDYCYLWNPDTRTITKVAPGEYRDIITFKGNDSKSFVHADNICVYTLSLNSDTVS